jgi:hypothetical protein
MKKKILVYMLLFVLALSGISLIQKADLSMADILYYAALVLATFLGVIHVIMMNKLRFPQASRPFGFRFWVTIFILFTSVIISFVSYRLLSLDARFLTFIIPFIVPYFVWHSFIIFSEKEPDMN